MTRHFVAALGLTGFLCTGCGVSGVTNGVVANMDRVRDSPTVRDGARFAPQEFELAESERALSGKASREGDETAAALYAAQAVASYSDTVVLARLARATIASDAASSDLARDEARAQKLAIERAEAELLADELAKKLKVAQDALIPATSGRADPEREAARFVAARSLAAEARLLCGAARLVSPSQDGLDALDKDVAALDRELDGAKKGPAPIDRAGHTRAACLAGLTRARRTSDASRLTEPDALLSELSASRQFEPSRDERGVVIVLRDAFRGIALSPPGSEALAELGRVAVTHPGFAVQIVVHDAAPPSAVDAASDAQRAEAAVAALVLAGVPRDHVRGETVGARVPLVDPQDARRRARNARLEVVFVTPNS